MKSNLSSNPEHFKANVHISVKDIIYCLGNVSIHLMQVYVLYMCNIYMQLDLDMDLVIYFSDLQYLNTKS